MDGSYNIFFCRTKPLFNVRGLTCISLDNINLGQHINAGRVLFQLLVVFHVKGKRTRCSE